MVCWFGLKKWSEKFKAALIPLHDDPVISVLLFIEEITELSASQVIDNCGQRKLLMLCFLLAFGNLSWTCFCTIPQGKFILNLLLYYFPRQNLTFLLTLFLFFFLSILKISLWVSLCWSILPIVFMIQKSNCCIKVLKKSLL